MQLIWYKKATGDVIGFVDADTDIQIRTFNYALKEIRKTDVMAVVPSKLHSESNVEMKLSRKIFSYGLILLNRMFLNLPESVTDVGCGLKLFKRDLIKRILPNLKVNRFAIDSEILNESGRVGYPVSVIPFFMNKNRSDSTSANIKEMSRMLTDIVKISLKDNRIYNSKLLKAYR